MKITLKPNKMPSPKMAYTLSLLKKQVADQQRAVVVFREEFLKGGLLSKHDVEAWIAKHAETDGPPTTWVDVPLPRECRIDVDKETGRIFTEPLISISRKNGARACHLEYLSYGVPKDRWERSIPVADRGVLDRLRQISVDLGKRFGWQEAQATLFVLTGNIPASSPLKSTVNFNRIMLDIDPSTTAGQLTEYYLGVRRKLLEKRSRALSEKHLQLATFPATLPKTKWEDRLDNWNQKYPDWEYFDLGIFRRDCRLAQRRLLKEISIDRLFHLGKHPLGDVNSLSSPNGTACLAGFRRQTRGSERR